MGKEFLKTIKKPLSCTNFQQSKVMLMQSLQFPEKIYRIK